METPELKKLREQRQLKKLGQLLIYFGKHKGQTLQQVYQKDPQYLRWISSRPDFNPPQVRNDVLVYMNLRQERQESSRSQQQQKQQQASETKPRQQCEYKKRYQQELKKNQLLRYEMQNQRYAHDDLKRVYKNRKIDEEYYQKQVQKQMKEGENRHYYRKQITQSERLNAQRERDQYYRDTNSQLQQLARQLSLIYSNESRNQQFEERRIYTVNMIRRIRTEVRQLLLQIDQNQGEIERLQQENERNLRQLRRIREQQEQAELQRGRELEIMENLQRQRDLERQRAERREQEIRNQEQRNRQIVGALFLFMSVVGIQGFLKLMKSRKL